MSGHTPGPWIVRSPEKDSHAFDVFPEGNLHLKLHHGHWGGEADARLIAAAPELLEACVAAERAFRLVVGTDPDAEIVALAILRTAIAKAEGRIK